MLARHAGVAAAVMGLAWFATLPLREPSHALLETELKPELLDESAAWPRRDWTVTAKWHGKKELRIEALERFPGPFVTRDELRVEFDPPGAPEVRVDRTMRSQEGQVWSVVEIRGRAWISSDGTGLGEPGGPPLAIQWEYNCTNAGSLSHYPDKLLLTSEQLLRK